MVVCVNQRAVGRPDLNLDLDGFARTAFWNAGLQVPDQISVVGYDNTFTASLVPVSLTTVDQAGTELGVTAGRLLVERIEGRTVAVETLLEPLLIARKTTAVLGNAVTHLGSISRSVLRAARIRSARKITGLSTISPSTMTTASLASATAARMWLAQSRSSWGG